MELSKKLYISIVLWVSPFAKSIIESGSVTWIEWDATFSFCTPYSLMIPSAIINNTAIPLGFMICPSEKGKYYCNFYDFIVQNIKHDLINIPILVDMGKAIKKFLKKKN